MSRLTRSGTAELVSRDQILMRERGKGNIHFPCSADHEQDWQPYPVDPYSAIRDDHTYYTPLVGVGKERRIKKLSMVKPEKAASVATTTFRTSGPAPADSRQYTRLPILLVFS